jgi:hypothetical protein
MPVTTNAPTKSDTSAKADTNSEDDKEREITADNITNKELVTAVWYSLGSPSGTVDEWLARCKDNGVW